MLLLLSKLLLIGAVTFSDNQDLLVAKSLFLQECRSEALAQQAIVKRENAETVAAINQNFAIQQAIFDKLTKEFEEKQKAEEEYRRAVDDAVSKQQEAARENIKQFEEWKEQRTQETLQLSLTESNIIPLADGVVLNDGYEKDISEVFTVAPVARTWESRFYDVAIPYNLKCYEVGGFAMDVDTTIARYKYSAVSKGYQNLFVGERINQELTYLPRNVGGKTLTVKKDSYGVEYYEVEGKQCYGIALAAGLFPESMQKLGFSGFSSFRSKGIYADLILTNNQVVHCIVIDGIGEQHSNSYSDGWTASSTRTAQDHTRYLLSATIHKQYKEFFHAASCHVVEMSGNLAGFIKEFGFDDNVRIMYVRIYERSVANES